MSRAKVVLALGEAPRAALLARSHDDVEILSLEPHSSLDAAAIGDRDVELHAAQGSVRPLGARVAEAITLHGGGSVRLTLGKNAGALDDRESWRKSFAGLRLVHVEVVELGLSADLEADESGVSQAGDTLWFVMDLLQSRAALRAEPAMPVDSAVPVVVPAGTRRPPSKRAHAGRRRPRGARARKRVKAVLVRPGNASALLVVVVALSVVAWRVFSHTQDLVLAVAAAAATAGLLGTLVVLVRMRRSIHRLRTEVARSERERVGERVRSARRARAAERRHRALVTTVEELANALAVFAATSAAKDLSKR